MATYNIATTMVNETKGYWVSDFTEPVEDWLLKDDGTPDFGAIFRIARSDYGRCVSSMYVDAEGGPRRVGWVFQKRCKYDDCNDTYLQETWVSLYTEVPAVRTLVEVS
jgi:hypothetical protein